MALLKINTINLDLQVRQSLASMAGTRFLTPQIVHILNQYCNSSINTSMHRSTENRTLMNRPTEIQPTKQAFGSASSKHRAQGTGYRAQGTGCINYRPEQIKISENT